MIRGALAVMLLAIFVAGVVAFRLTRDDFSKAALDLTQREGEKVVAAIQAYKRDHADYPATLEELMPTYLPALPSPAAGAKRWTYQRLSGDYMLTARSRLYGIKPGGIQWYGYAGSIGVWKLEDW
jgi:hypothetical protein